MTTAREQAREAAIHYPGTILSVSERTDLRAGADAASDVWANDYLQLAELLADETVAPQKRIDSAIAWIKDSVQ